MCERAAGPAAWAVLGAPALERGTSAGLQRLPARSGVTNACTCEPSVRLTGCCVAGVPSLGTPPHPANHAADVDV